MPLISLDNLYNIFVKCDFIHNRKTTHLWQINRGMTDCNNLVLIYDGNGVFERNGIRKIVHRGDVVFFSRGDYRYMSTNPDDLLKFYTVNFHAMLPTKKNGQWDIADVTFPFEFIKTIDNSEIFSRLLSKSDKLCHINLINSNNRTSKERELFLEILELILFVYENRDINFANKNKVDKIIKYMSDNYSGKITLKMLADFANISISYLNTIFKNITQKSPIDYLIDIRINKAKQLLTDGYSITEIATLTGFADIYYFSNTFKRSEGISPNEYKRTMLYS